LNYYKNIKLLNTCFLTWKTDDMFDLIVGNPPYFEKSLFGEEKNLGI